MSLGSMIGVLVGAFVVLVLIVWVLVASSKPGTLRPRKGDQGGVGEPATTANDDGAKKTTADEQSRNTTTAVAAWWWLNHNRDSEDKRTGEDKPS